MVRREARFLLSSSLVGGVRMGVQSTNMMSDLFKSVVTMFLLVVTITSVVVAPATNSEPSTASVSVEFLESTTQLYTAVCSKPSSHGLAMVRLMQDDRVLEKVSSDCTTPPCVKQEVRVASQGILANKSDPSNVSIAWEPRAALDIRPDRLSCRYFANGGVKREDPVVRLARARKLTWYMDKDQAGLTKVSCLEIEVEDGLRGRRSFGKETVPEGEYSVKLYELGPGGENVTVVKINSTPEFCSIDILTTNDGLRFPTDPSQRKCRVGVAGRVWDCDFKPSQPPCRLGSPDPSSSLCVSELACFIGAVVGAVLAVLLLVIGLVFFCRRARKERSVSANSVDAEREKSIDPEAIPLSPGTQDTSGDTSLHQVASGDTSYDQGASGIQNDDYNLRQVQI